MAHASTIKLGSNALCCVLCDLSAASIVRVPSEREMGVVLRRYHVHAEARPPHLHESWIRPRCRQRALDSGVNRQQRRSRHRVLETGPGYGSERIGSGGKALIEGADPPSVREDLVPRERELRLRHPCVELVERGSRTTTGVLVARVST